MSRRTNTFVFISDVISRKVERTEATPGGIVRHRSRQSWYSAAAAKNISEETRYDGDNPEDEGEAALALERRLHAPPAIQFVSENRRGGFNKVTFARHRCLGWNRRMAGIVF